VRPKEVVRDGHPVHNRLSGDPDRPPEDIRISAEVDTVCRAVGLELLEHAIVGRNLGKLPLPSSCGARSVRRGRATSVRRYRAFRAKPLTR